MDEHPNIRKQNFQTCFFYQTWMKYLINLDLGFWMKCSLPRIQPMKVLLPRA